MSIRKKLGLLGATFFTAAAGMAVPAMAQDAPQPAQAGSQAEPQEEEVVVTGSRIRRDEFTSTAPIQVITGETATLEGLIDAGEVLQSSSVAAGSFQLNGQFGGFVVEGGTGINSVSLRGLGAQRSLVLLNGRRPGPAGVRGQVGAFDLNVIPSSVVQRYEILKDGASSVYGSDAVAGVVNVITVDRIDDPIINFEINQPFEDGGESYSIDGAYGLNFSRGNVVIAGQYQVREDLSVGDRDYLSCPQDLIYSPTTGARIDREDRSILRNTNLAGCNNIYFNTVIVGANRYVPSPNGVTTGPIPGYRPRANRTYAQAPQ
ncbi:MAG: TonB-dependent receptor plug domain-containing protein, partial [Hyphomonadaceae bacterium]|nr:TonB-dependent receptor plug domain-containing protein [Hyphomonadaceae bacterium]